MQRYYFFETRATYCRICERFEKMFVSLWAEKREFYLKLQIMNIGDKAHCRYRSYDSPPHTLPQVACGFLL